MKERESRTARRRPEAIQSMTGFASVSRELPGAHLGVELRCVNSRYLDLTFRMPDELRLHETALRESIGASITRGKLECRVWLRERSIAASAPSIDEAALSQAAMVIARLSQAVPGLAPASIGDLLRWPGLVTEPNASETIAQELPGLAAEALAELVEARAREGARLCELIRERLDTIESIADTLSARAPELLTAFEARLVERLEAALAKVPGGAALAPDETAARLRQEVAAYGLRIDVAEELDRLRTHVGECRRVLGGSGPVGKRLDFLVQELNREANTLASKAAAVDLSAAAVDLKVLIEQIREQLQNLE